MRFVCVYVCEGQFLFSFHLFHHFCIQNNCSCVPNSAKNRMDLTWNDPLCGQMSVLWPTFCAGCATQRPTFVCKMPTFVRPLCVWKPSILKKNDTFLCPKWAKLWTFWAKLWTKSDTFWWFWTKTVNFLSSKKWKLLSFCQPFWLKTATIGQEINS